VYRWFLVGLIVSGLLLAGAGCADDADDADEPVTLKLAQQPDFETLDPHDMEIFSDAKVARHVYEGLVMFDQQGNVQPRLAEDWETEDAQTWTFYLREGVTFHDGTEFNAEAVQISLNRILDEDLALRRRPVLDFIEEVRAVDEYTVEIVLEAPNAALLTNLCHWAGSIISPAALQEHGADIGNNPVGTGPYKFEKWEAGDRVTLQKYDDYWQSGVGFVDRIEFLTVVEDGTRVAMLETDEVDVIHPVPPESIEELRENPDTEVYTGPYNRVLFINLNFERENMQDVLVRRAIAHAIDVDEIVRSILFDTATVPDSILAPETAGYHSSGAYEHDPEQAQSLLQQAGWEKNDDGYWEKDGEVLTFRLVTPDGRYPKDSEIGLAVTGYLEDIGIESSLDTLEWGSYLDRINQEDPDDAEYDGFILGWGPGTNHADFTLRPMFATDSFPPGWNRGYYSNPDVDDRLSRARTTGDMDESEALYAEVQEILFDEVAYIGLADYRGIAAHSVNVEGIVTLPLEIVELTGARMSEENSR